MSQKAIDKKKLQVASLKERLENANSFVIVDYSGLTVEQVTKLRVALLENDCEMSVIKNNISKRATEMAGYTAVADVLTGPNAIAFSNADSVSAAKVIYEFAKDNKALELKVGVVDGEYMDQENIQKIATIPSREELLTMIAAGLLEPVKEIAIALDLMAQEQETETEEA
ncbi:MAG: 50S ribosomal protein L10 [Candidatus Izimaplasma sp.]|nr:50S ribosomal protein L10 [Candidatus Izimaplasma bacterium]